MPRVRSLCPERCFPARLRHKILASNRNARGGGLRPVGKFTCTCWLHPPSATERNRRGGARLGDGLLQSGSRPIDPRAMPNTRGGQAYLRHGPGCPDHVWGTPRADVISPAAERISPRRGVKFPPPAGVFFSGWAGPDSMLLLGTNLFPGRFRPRRGVFFSRAGCIFFRAEVFFPWWCRVFFPKLT